MGSSDLRGSISISRALSVFFILVIAGCGPFSPGDVQPNLIPLIVDRVETANSEFKTSGRTQQSVNFTVLDRIGGSQISEFIALEVNGVPLQEIRVSKDHPESEVTGTVPLEGRFEYRVSGVLVRVEGDTRQTLRLVGAGTVVIRQGSRLAVSLPESGPTHGIVVLFALNN